MSPPAEKGIRVAFYSDATAWGGAEVSLARLLGALAPWVEAIVMGTDSVIVDRLGAARPGSPTVRLPAADTKRDLRAMWAHRHAIVRAAPDVFHANLTSLWSCQYALLAALTVRGVRVVAVEHSPLASASGNSRRLKRLTSSRLAAHVAVGERAGREVERFVGLPAGAVQTIHNGVPAPRPVRPERVSADPVVGTVGRLDHLKGVDLLLRAGARLPGVHLAIVGDGPARAELEQLARDLGVADRVHFLGWQEDPAPWVAGFDVFALPSRLEGFPLTILEAMLAGRPVVATDVGSVSEAVADGETGILVAVDDEVALSAALARLAGDAGLRQSMGQAGLRRAEGEFTLAAMAGRYEALYRSITAGRAPGRQPPAGP